MKKNLIAIICFLIITNVAAFFWVLEREREHLKFSRYNRFYKWLNPQLKFTETPVLDKASYESFRIKLNEILEKEKTEGRISNAAVFFRDLIDGPTLSINPNEGFAPASLLKMPLAITYFRLAEEKKVYLDQELSANNFTLDLEQRFPPAVIIEKGKPYKIEYLLKHMIVCSNNNAWEILFNYLEKIPLDEDALLKTFKELGLIDTASKDVGEELLSVKSYAAIFRMLYNASYLSKEFSDKLLNDLSQSTFKDGLSRGVPSSIPIAHKFGERFTDDNFQLHDCGIVYYPQNPYLLCVMTKGKNFNALSEIIGTVSKAVYEEVNSRLLK